jgi:hypothetical protein
MLVEKPGHKMPVGRQSAGSGAGPRQRRIPPAAPGAPLRRRTRAESTQPVVVPPSRPFGMAESFFSALNSSVAWVLFHSTESPAFV